jgi:hypothetical protein
MVAFLVCLGGLLAGRSGSKGGGGVSLALALPLATAVFVSHLVVVAGYVSAECANACSNHGECSTRHDYCICNDGWMGASCDQRVCPRALSFIDSPIGDLNYDNLLQTGGHMTLNPSYQRAGAWERHAAQLYNDVSASKSFAAKNDEGHFYVECANRGICDRATGLCDCFTGCVCVACQR